MAGSDSVACINVGPWRIRLAVVIMHLRRRETDTTRRRASHPARAANEKARAADLARRAAKARAARQARARRRAVRAAWPSRHLLRYTPDRRSWHRRCARHGAAN